MGKKNKKHNQTEKKKPETKDKSPFVEPKLVKHGDVKDITAGGHHGSYYP